MVFYKSTIDKILYVVSLLCLVNTGHAQTYISPSIGWEFSEIQSDFSNSDYQTPQRKVITNDPLFGIKVDQNIYKHLYLSYNFNYSRKFVPASSQAFIEIEGVRIDCYRSSLLFVYYTKNLFIGAGGYIDFINSINEVYLSGPAPLPENFYKNTREYGLRSSMGLIINHFELELFGYYGLENPQSSDGVTFLSEPFISMGINVNYNFKLDIFKAKSSTISNCPKF